MYTLILQENTVANISLRLSTYVFLSINGHTSTCVIFFNVKINSGECKYSHSLSCIYAFINKFAVSSYVLMKR